MLKRMMMFVMVSVIIMAAGKGNTADCPFVCKRASQAICMSSDDGKDAKPSSEEFKAMQTERFNKIDTNKDGVISLEEWLADVPPCGDRKGPDGKPDRSDSED